jgi:leucyl-tRNA synthetase
MISRINYLIYFNPQICVNPDDERYAHLVGKEAEVPMSGGRRIPIIADGYVDAEFGTGCLKITPGHDANDYEIGQRFGLPIINIMNKVRPPPVLDRNSIGTMYYFFAVFFFHINYALSKCDTYF